MPFRARKRLSEVLPNGLGLIFMVLGLLVVPQLSVQLVLGLWGLACAVAIVSWTYRQLALYPDHIMVRELYAVHAGRVQLRPYREIPLKEIRRVEVAGARFWRRRYDLYVYETASPRPLRLVATPFRQSDVARIVDAIAKNAPAVTLTPQVERLRVGKLYTADNPSPSAYRVSIMLFLVLAQMFVTLVPLDASQHHGSHLLVLDHLLAVYTGSLLVFVLYRLFTWWMYRRKGASAATRRSPVALICTGSGVAGLVLTAIIVVTDVATGYSGDWDTFGLGWTFFAWAWGLLGAGGGAAQVRL